MERSTPYDLARKLLLEDRYDELIELLVPLVKADESWVQAMLGYCYETGAGVVQDIVLARHCYELAARQNDPDGHFLMGHYLLRKGQVEEGRVQLEAAYIAGNRIAATYLAKSFFTESTDSASHSYEMVDFWLKKAELGDDLEGVERPPAIILERVDKGDCYQWLDCKEESAVQRWFTNIVIDLDQPISKKHIFSITNMSQSRTLLVSSENYSHQELLSKINQGRYDKEGSLLNLISNAENLNRSEILKAAQQRLKIVAPNTYRKVVGPLCIRDPTGVARCYCGRPEGLKEIARQIIDNSISRKCLLCDSCWSEDICAAWGTFGPFGEKLIDKERWRAVCEERGDVKFGM